MKTLFLFFITTLILQGQNLNQPLGDYVNMREGKSSLIIETTHGQLRAIVYSPNVIRISISKNEIFEDDSYAVITDPILDAKYKIISEADRILLTTDSIDLIIFKKPIRLQFKNKNGQIVNEDDKAFGTSWIGEEATTYKKLQEGEKFIGLGEKTGNLNRRGEGYTNWNTDYYAYPANADAIYSTIPFYMGLHHGLSYGIFMDNSYKSHFNFGASNDRFSSFTAEDGTMNYYFIYHSTVKDIIASYTLLTGRMEMPPLWSLGLTQCRYSYYPDSEVISLAKTYRAKKIPADGITLDIHYMDAYKIFTWDKTRFPDPKGMNASLKEMGFHTTVICDPGIKVEVGYKPYEEGVAQNLFLKYPDSTIYKGQVWPGWCHFPDFTKPDTRKWWGNLFKDYVDKGVEGFWNDMNEPATWGQKIPNLIEFDFDGKKATHKKGHNIYGINMARSTFEGTKALLNGKRPFILTRSGYSGVQRYAAVWTGDNISTDEHLMTGIRLLTSMGLSGIPFTGMDVGGFTGNPTQNLFARWITIGAFSPYFRIHSGINTKESDPWSYGEKVEAISKNYIGLRYKMLPYIYSLFYEAHQTGMPVVRSLAINDTHDPKIYESAYQNQYMFGASLMVAPFESTKELGKVYLPSGSAWYDFYTDKFFKSKQELITECPVDKLPVFVKGGSIIPMQSLVQHTMEQPSDTLLLHIYSGSERNSFTYYEDNGSTYEYNEGAYFKRDIKFNPGGRNIIFTKSQGNISSKFKKVKLVLHGFPENQFKWKGNKIKLESEKLQFIQPLPNFDPVGSVSPGDFTDVKTFVMENDAQEIVVSW